MLVCVKCRKVRPPCDHEKISVDGNRWRAPKITNEKAWRRIESGDIWWDKRHIRRTADQYWYHFGERFGRRNKSLRKQRQQSSYEKRLERDHLAALIENRRRKNG